MVEKPMRDLFGCIALLGVHNEQFGNEVLRVLTHVVPLGGGKIELSTQYLTIHDDVVVRGKRRVSAQPTQNRPDFVQNVSDHANGPDVHRRPVDLPLHDFRGKVPRGSAGGGKTIHRMGLLIRNNERPLHVQSRNRRF